MKITEDLRRVAEQFGRQYDLKEGDLGKELWDIVDCMEMIQSHLAYEDSDFMDSRYSKSYCAELGYGTVKEIWETMKRYFDENCYIQTAVYTDSEGLTYNSIIDRNEI